MDEFTTFAWPKPLSSLAVGYESYGELTAKKDNVYLINPLFFQPILMRRENITKDDAQAAYCGRHYWSWPKAIDTNTNEYFVISVDTLVNLKRNACPPPITTRLCNYRPQIQANPYGLTFPVVTIRDFANVPKKAPAP